MYVHATKQNSSWVVTSMHAQIEDSLANLQKLIPTFIYVGVNVQSINIVTNPIGLPVAGQINTFDYPILTNVTLMCIVASSNGSLVTAISYNWMATDCYSNTVGGTKNCFYSRSHARQNFTGYDLLAKDAGTVECEAIIDEEACYSQLTLRVSGTLLVLVLL